MAVLPEIGQHLEHQLPFGRRFALREQPDVVGHHAAAQVGGELQRGLGAGNACVEIVLLAVAAPRVVGDQPDAQAIVGQLFPKLTDRRGAEFARFEPMSSVDLDRRDVPLDQPRQRLSEG
ncbi:MAG: hypothetical protein QM811_01755 [Pirellulales bacterium]